MPRAWPDKDGKHVTWEACQTFSGSWGYHRDEDTWKSPEQLIQMLVGTVAHGRQPADERGTDGTRRARLAGASGADRMGNGSRSNGEASMAARSPRIPAPQDCRLTQNGNRLYVHIFTWPFHHLHFDAIAGKVEYAQLLHDGSEIEWLKPTAGKLFANTQIVVANEALTFVLPVRKPPVVVPVIEIFLKE